MQILPTILLAIVAFGLGACPFSVWIGRWFLGKDIRDYGDGNPVPLMSSGQEVLRQVTWQ